MQDIRFLDTDGENLILEGEDGLRFRLLIDESLRKAIRHDPTTRLDSSAISPREIQNAVRNGATVGELVARTGAPESYVEKFAGPVIDELTHIVASALSVRITIAGDRYNESNQLEFGEIISSRLQLNGASAGTWSCRRTETEGWLISCRFGLNGVEHDAVWHFVPRKLALSPENETAVSLSSLNSLTESPIAKLRPVAEPAGNAKASTPPTVQNQTDNVSVINLTPEPVAAPPATQNLTENLGDTLEFEGVVPFGRSKPKAEATVVNAPTNSSADSPSSEVPLSETADLLEALRQKRISREAGADGDETKDSEELGDEPLAAETELDDLGSYDIESDHVGTGFTEEVEPIALKPTANYKKGRPSIPSWDEIVFGSTKQDD